MLNTYPNPRSSKKLFRKLGGCYGVPSHLYEIIKSACGNVNSFVHALEEIRNTHFRIQHLEDHWNTPKHNKEWKTQQEILKKNFTSSSEGKMFASK